MTEPLRPVVGRVLTLVGVVHALLYLLPQVYGRQLWRMARAGLWNTCPHRPLSADTIVLIEHEAAFWGTMAGVFLALLGMALHEIERLNGGVVPRPIVWTWIAASLVGTIVMPISGFPILCLPLGIVMARRQP